MPVQDLDFTGRSLLAIFAHPDDEALACGGLLAWCADLGARVVVMCATHGGGGSAAVGNITDVRARELDAAARVLGVTDVVVLNYEDGMLPWVDAAALEADIGSAIRRLRPEVVITFGEDGLYWHPDHIAIHERTTAAVAALGADAPALYYVTMPPGRMRAVLDAAAARYAVEDTRRSILGVADVDAFGTLAAEPTLVVAAGDFAGRKLDAIKCHQTQLANDALHLLSQADAITLLGTEHFRRAEMGRERDSFIERLSHARSPA